MKLLLLRRPHKLYSSKCFVIPYKSVKAITNVFTVAVQTTANYALIRTKENNNNRLCVMQQYLTKDDNTVLRTPGGEDGMEEPLVLSRYVSNIGLITGAWAQWKPYRTFPSR